MARGKQSLLESKSINCKRETKTKTRLLGGGTRLLEHGDVVQTHVVLLASVLANVRGPIEYLLPDAVSHPLEEHRTINKSTPIGVELEEISTNYPNMGVLVLQPSVETLTKRFLPLLHIVSVIQRLQGFAHVGTKPIYHLFHLSLWLRH